MRNSYLYKIHKAFIKLAPFCCWIVPCLYTVAKTYNTYLLYRIYCMKL